MNQAIVVMGVAGSGKTTLGNALADASGRRFIDADDYHPATNVAKMKSGQPLTDADRWPWLDTLSEMLGEPVVLACSALKASYRARLVSRHPARFVYLRISPETASERLGARAGHFMPQSLIDSQFATLEEPVGALVLQAEQPLDQLLQLCLRQLGEASSPTHGI